MNQQDKTNSRRVKHAAYASMASVVGSKRAWSRAVLSKIRNRSLLLKKKKKKRRRRSSDEFGELRKIVPGGQLMNFYNLLDETADYINSLTSQVQVMKNILNLLST
ncbi:transcription factor IBH1-like [Solanum pennellii]|uniref:Transcription factor IBH1-like n=1 Tax=Solanum pennellii TaxID=28526 RepID=A0ABM1HKW4_SOLPN|nr:transcription factor IBH1-like [Solanum pennellii]